MSLYEITLEREVLREKSAGIMADLDRYIDKKNIADSIDPIVILKKNVADIFFNVFKAEYKDPNKLIEANAKLNLAADIISKLSF